MIRPFRPQRHLPIPARQIRATDILSGRASLHGYPRRYVVIYSLPGARLFAGPSMVEQTMAAVELLETQGWEVVNFEQGGFVAFMRRPEPPRPVEPPPIPRR